MNLLENIPITLETSGNWRVERNIYNGNLCLYKNDNFLIHDHDNYIYKDCSSILSLTPSSVLILGLGLSLIPNYFANTITDIDVVENDTDLINLITGNSFNNSVVNIIYGDAYTYTTNKTYDLIISDIHWFFDGNYATDIEILRQSYNSNLNEGGKIFFYLGQELFDKY